MRKALIWIFGILAALIVVGWLFFGRSDRQAYRVAKGAVDQRVQVSQDRIDLAVELATKSVDMALLQAGNLPSQQAQADLIKQDIEEIGRRLKEVAQAQGDVAIAKLDQSIEQFNSTLDRVDSASKQAENPEVKSALDRIYGILESVKEQLTTAILNTQK
jgi:hypothetical protein